MKKLNVLTRMLLLVALLVGSVNVWGQSDKSAVYSSNVTLSATGGTKATASTVSINSTNYNAMKLGSSGKSGNFNVTFPAGTKYIHIHAAAWKGKNSNTLNFSAITNNSYSSPTLPITLTANSGIQGQGTEFTFGTGNSDSNPNSSNHYKVITLANALTSNTQITITCSERCVVWGINSESAGVTSLSIKTAPTKVRYEVGENLDMSGFVLDADGTEVSSGYTMTMGGAAITNGAILSSAGKKTITVAYGGKTVDQAISVGAVTGIEVTTHPTKTSYDTGDSFDPTGMVVTASLSTGEAEDPDTWTKEVTGYTISPDGALAPANTSVTITYAGQTTTQNITVSNVAVTDVSIKASTTIEKGKTETLTPTFTPSNATNKNVSWKSDDTSVATVDEDGVVTAVAAGTANITVTTEEGGKTAICVVTVVNQKGSIDAPYSVAEVINGDAAGKENIYVIGYIVGEYQQPSKTKTTVITSSFTTDANIALADNPTTTALASSIPIQLPTDALKTPFGNKTNDGTTMGYKILAQGDVTSYFTVTGIKNTSEVTGITVPVTVSDANKYATFASTQKVNFTDTGISAYKATVTGTTVDFTQVNVVPAGEGVLLYAAGGATVNVPVTTADADFTGNKLVRGTGASLTWVEGNTEYYILANETAGIGFYKANNNVVAKNRAYLNLNDTNAKSITMPGTETDGIRSIENGTENGAVYNLSGQKVGADYKGIVIVNGKKYVRK